MLYILPSVLQSKVSGLMGMTKTSVIRMFSAVTKATNVDSNIMLGYMIVFRAGKCQRAIPTMKRSIDDDIKTRSHSR